MLAGTREPTLAPSSQEQVCWEVRVESYFLFTAARVEKLTAQPCCPGLSVFKYQGDVFML